MQLKTTRLLTNLYTINKNDLQTNTNKIDGIAFRGGAHQARFQKVNLKPDWE